MALFSVELQRALLEELSRLESQGSASRFFTTYRQSKMRLLVCILIACRDDYSPRKTISLLEMALAKLHSQGWAWERRADKLYVKCGYFSDVLIRNVAIEIDFGYNPRFMWHYYQDLLQKNDDLHQTFKYILESDEFDFSWHDYLSHEFPIHPEPDDEMSVYRSLGYRDSDYNSGEITENQHNSHAHNSESQQVRNRQPRNNQHSTPLQPASESQNNQQGRGLQPISTTQNENDQVNDVIEDAVQRTGDIVLNSDYPVQNNLPVSEQNENNDQVILPQANELFAANQQNDGYNAVPSPSVPPVQLFNNSYCFQNLNQPDDEESLIQPNIEGSSAANEIKTNQQILDSLNIDSKDIPKCLKCASSKVIMTDPVYFKNKPKVKYERRAIAKELQKQPINPVTGAAVDPKTPPLRKDDQLKQLIDYFVHTKRLEYEQNTNSDNLEPEQWNLQEQDIPDQYKCYIYFHIMTTPVYFKQDRANGLEYVFELNGLLAYLENNSLHPHTRRNVDHSEIRIDERLKDEIKDFVMLQQHNYINGIDRRPRTG